MQDPFADPVVDSWRRPDKSLHLSQLVCKPTIISQILKNEFEIGSDKPGDQVVMHGVAILNYGRCTLGLERR